MVRSSRRRKRRTHVKEVVDVDAPRIVVIRRGSLRPELKQLVQDLRLLVSPNCASRLKEAANQKMKDFTQVSEALGLTHIIAVSETDRGCYLKIANLPNGPTLTFSIDLLTLVTDIAKYTSNPKSIGGTCHNSPLVVLNGFSGPTDGHKRLNGDDFAPMKTVSTTFNSLFSPIDISTTKMSSCKRVVLFNKNKESDVIVLRHYLINLVDCNTSSAVQDLIDKRSVKRLMRDKSASFKDLVKSVTGPTSSDLMDEDYLELHNTESRDHLLRSKYGLTKPGDLEDVCETGQKLGISLVDAGPRLNLRLIKIQDGVFTGAVTFHKFVSKRPEEIELLEKTFSEKRRKAKEEEAKRREQQKNDDMDDDADQDNLNDNGNLDDVDDHDDHTGNRFDDQDVNTRKRKHRKTRRHTKHISTDKIHN
ncbi:Brix domain containing protein, putative [Babesia ovis]|uniref:Brix domain containing protein, putative n=1 Tax=Babesia ovis TaxID=5869 RepID=A0A9W5T8I5_BABOV|nr:Brix domain containing protein, putative [Babesia ovis]